METNNNLNQGFYKNLDENFETACILAEKKFTHTELLNMLNNGNIPEKQIAALKFDYIHSEKDAETLIKNLTGCDGKIREAIALKIYQLLSTDQNTAQFFIQYPKIFANASIDINGNICRLIADSVVYLKQYNNFAMTYANIMVNYAKEALCELDKFIFRDKKYVINKQLFKLYWCLEELTEFYEYTDLKSIKDVLNKCSKIEEYTIREKVAKIAILSSEFSDIAENLKNDQNYYVREILKN